MAAIERKTKRYPTDLTDEEWTRIAPLLPKPARRGRKPGVDLREVLNAIRYMTGSGGGGRMLPRDFPPWQTVYWWFRRFVRLMQFRTIHDIALMMDRERAGREASPSAGVVQSDGESTGAWRPARLRRGQEDGWAQAACGGRYRRPPVDGQPHAGRHLRQCRRASDPRCHPQALAVDQASVRRRRL